jgi:hypothetical protein
MMDLPANKFVTLIKNILMKEIDLADAMLVGKDGLVKDAIRDASGETEGPVYSEEDLLGGGDLEDEEGGNELIDFFNKPSKKQEVEEKPEPKQKKWFEYSRGELNNFLNKAIDEQDWTKAREIQAAIERKDNNNK